jgi:hypothetical protein
LRANELGNVCSTHETESKGVLVENCEGKPLGRPTDMWEDNI